MAKKAKHPGGRPQKVWTDHEIAQFKSMCNMFCTEEEICATMNVDDKTLVRLINHHLYKEITGHELRGTAQRVGFKEAFEKYSAQGRASLRRQQYILAKEGDRTMLIWLGKQYLGQTDKVEEKVTDVPYIVDDIG